MCRRYQFFWQCDCERKDQKHPVICCPTSEFLDNDDTPPSLPKARWLKASQTDIDSQHLGCFGTTWENPIKLELKRNCYSCLRIPTNDCDDFPNFAMNLQKGSSLCMKMLRTNRVTISVRLYPNVLRFCEGLNWRSTYEELRWFGDISPEDLEWLNSLLDSIECLLEKADGAQAHFRTHFNKEIFSEDFLLTLKQVRAMETFLKTNLALNALLARDDEFISRIKPALLTKVSLGSIKKEECFICKDTLGEKNEEGDYEEAVETPCHHTLGSFCAHRWFIQDKHEHCPFCRTRLPRYQYEYFDDRKPTPAWLAFFSVDRARDLMDILQDAPNIPGVTGIDRP